MFVRGTIILGVLWSATFSTAYAQPIDREEGGPTTEFADTYVDDSFEASSMLKEVESLARRGRWVEASRMAQRVFDLHSNRLVRVEHGLYEGVAKAINRRISRWPAAGLKSYRSLYDEKARDRFEAALDRHDVGAMLEVLDRYFCTSVGIEIAEAGCDLALESADFALARRICVRVLTSHPDRAAVEPEFLARLTVIAALEGANAELEKWLPHDDRGAFVRSIRFMGREQQLAALVDRLESEARDPRDAADSFYWPVFGGNGERNGVATFPFEPTVLLWQFDDFPSGSLGVRAMSNESASLRRAIEAGKFLIFNPVAGNGLIYFQDADEVWALQGGSGSVVWHFGGAGGEGLRHGSTDVSLPEWHSPTLKGDRLYACLGGTAVPYYGFEVRTNAAVICLDSGTGQLLWRADRERFGDSFAKMRFDASPLVSEDFVYVVARRRRTFGFEDCYLLRLRATDGTLMSKTHLGSASTGGFGFRRATRSIPAMADDTVYVNTQLGTVAAVSAHTGRIRWLRLYEREPESEWRHSVRSSSRDFLPWQYNPVICTPEWLVCRPNDAARVLVLDRETGGIVRDFDVAALEGVASMLAVRDGTLYGVGDSVFAFDLDAGKTTWSTPLPDGAKLYGRGAVTSDRVLIPTSEYLCAYDLHAGTRAKQRWMSGSGGGNLLALADRLVVAGNDRISVYVRKQDAWARLRKRMTDRPDDPIPALDLAELSVRSGDLDQAALAFEVAIERAGGVAKAGEEAVLARIFRDCLWFARDWPKEQDADRQRVEQFFRYAARFAPDTAGHLTYRFRYASYLADHDDPARAVSVYQQVLDDRSLRDAIDPSASMPGESAAVVAEGLIEELIVRHGREVYARFDAEAAEWLEAARTLKDIALLDRIIETRPAASVCVDAMLHKSRFLREGGDARAAARSYSAVYNRLRGDERAPQLMRQIADCYAEAGQPGYAWRWLTKAAYEYPQARVDVSGRLMSLADYRQRFDFARDDVEIRYPKVALPLTSKYELSFEQPAVLLDPILPPSPESDWSRVYIYSDGAIHALTSRNGSPVWKNPAECRAQPDLLLATDRQAVMATRHEVFGVDKASGKRLWSHGRYPADLADPLADPEWIATYYGHAYDAGRLFSVQDGGMVMSIDVASGQERWKQSLTYRPAGPPVAFDRWLVYPANKVHEPKVFCVLDTATGDMIRTIDPGIEEHVIRLHITLDGRLVIVLSRSIHSYDLETGRPNWHVRRMENIIDESVQFDLDSIYLSDDNEHVEKIGLEKGTMIWRSESLFDRRGERAETFLKAGQLICASDRGLAVLDPVDGRVLRQSLKARGVALRGWRESASTMVALGSSLLNDDEVLTAYFDDPFGDDGQVGGSSGVKLGILDDAQTVTLRDGAIVLLNGRTLSGWATPTR